MSYHNQQVSYSGQNYQPQTRVNKNIDTYSANTNIISRNMQPGVQSTNNLTHGTTINQTRNYTPNNNSSVSKQHNVIHHDHSRSPQSNQNNTIYNPMQFHHLIDSSKKLLTNQSHTLTAPATNQIQSESHQYLNRINFLNQNLPQKTGA